MRRYFLLMGALVLMLAMVAACGDDDDGDDTDIADNVTTTMAGTDDEATADEAGVTATTDDGEATEADADMTGTESDGAAGTMDADATGTEDDDDADDGTEVDDDATGTEDDDADDGTEIDDDATGTEEDDMDDATGTEDDDADATGTDDDDSADATAGDDDDGGFGEPVTIDDFILTVNDVMVLDSGGVVAPDEGNQFLGVEMTVENTGSDEIGLARALMMTRLEDADGQQYDIDLAATAVAIFSGGFDPETEISPGSEITGVAGFQVPDDLSPGDLTLVIEPDNGERVEIQLNDDGDTP